jgi:hypothetical protein
MFYRQMDALLTQCDVIYFFGLGSSFGWGGSPNLYKYCNILIFTLEWSPSSKNMKGPIWVGCSFGLYLRSLHILEYNTMSIFGKRSQLFFDGKRLV